MLEKNRYIRNIIIDKIGIEGQKKLSLAKILVIGAGSWGTALANTLAYNNKNVFLWTEKQKISDQINKTKINKKYFKKILLHKNITSIFG